MEAVEVEAVEVGVEVEVGVGVEVGVWVGAAARPGKESERTQCRSTSLCGSAIWSTINGWTNAISRRDTSSKPSAPPSPHLH